MKGSELLVSNGNKKVGKDTIIMNLHTATYCPGIPYCPLRKYCYAWSNERLRPTVLAFRKRQEQQWLDHNAEYFVEEFKKLKRPGLEYVRFQEAGEFADQYDLDKLSDIAEGLKGVFTCYTYTCRTDLNFSRRSENLIISGSGFMVDNNFVAIMGYAYELLTEMSPNAVVCPNNCRNCLYCKTRAGRVIYQRIH